MSSAEQKKQLLSQKLFRNLKSKQKSTSKSNDDKCTSTSTAKKPKIPTPEEKETDLTKRAIEEINRDTQKAAKLADEIGPSGWRIKSTRMNKRFLANTMRSVLNHNERTKAKHETESKRKFEQLTNRPPKFGARVHSFQSSEERITKSKSTT
ncbi:protein POLR1D-like [Contarinia nasturtii]|uniref:protein POLR1D-like n=1 Tax=Contarinia nasturtii TaxID=265458 RepID=UPI0012D3F15B|nr:protein POLR1D-like [Contarinia nasturtii]